MKDKGIDSGNTNDLQLADALKDSDWVTKASIQRIESKLKSVAQSSVNTVFDYDKGVTKIYVDELKKFFDKYGIVVEDVHLTGPEDNPDDEMEFSFSSKRYGGDITGDTIEKLEVSLSSSPFIDDVFIDTQKYTVSVAFNNIVELY